LLYIVNLWTKASRCYVQLQLEPRDVRSKNFYQLLLAYQQMSAMSNTEYASVPQWYDGYRCLWTITVAYVRPTLEWLCRVSSPQWLDFWCWPKLLGGGEFPKFGGSSPPKGARIKLCLQYSMINNIAYALKTLPTYSFISRSTCYSYGNFPIINLITKSST